MNEDLNNNKGKLYVLASRPYIDQATYIIEQLSDLEKRVAYFHVFRDARVDRVPSAALDNPLIDLTSAEIITVDMVEQAALSGKYDVVVIDFIQSMCYTRKIGKRIKILQTMKYLRELSRRSGVHIVVLSAVKRKFDSDKYKYPRARDIKDAFFIVSFADTIVTMGMPLGSKFIYIKQVKGDKIYSLSPCIFWVHNSRRDA